MVRAFDRMFSPREQQERVFAQQSRARAQWAGGGAEWAGLGDGGGVARFAGEGDEVVAGVAEVAEGSGRGDAAAGGAHGCGDERGGEDLGLVARGAAPGDGEAARVAEGAGEAVRGVAARTGVVGEDDVAAARAGDAVGAVDELLAVVDPAAIVVGLAEHEVEAAI